MRSLVTGASGFLGGRLAQLLAAQGDEVVVLARPRSDLRHLADLPLTVIPGDLSDSAALARSLRGVDRLFHCAACSTDWAPFKIYYSANVTGTANLLEAARACPTLQRFVHVSTTDVYGYPAAPCDESHPLVDAGLPYNQTKRLGELAVWDAHRDHGLPVTIVRPATIYGPRGKDFTVEVATMLRQRLMLLIDHGRAPGGFTYIDNVAEAMIAASVSPKTLGQAYNLSDGSNADWTEYLARFSAALGCRPPWLDLSLANATRLARLLELPHRLLKLSGRPLLTRHAVLLLGLNQEFPIAKAARDFGYAPQVSLAEGIARSVDWLRQQ
ncbi:MAG TPA: NAD-dependent epimerase/dehydratase family protein [Granulicella sp.]|jgi:nucleoside-diphosphate-sugar epimerase|nr:NAD-dependent epimerase/dehydratase family protein [Granulicella sp.]